jgi:hypothetical protein
LSGKSKIILNIECRQKWLCFRALEDLDEEIRSLTQHQQPSTSHSSARQVTNTGDESPEMQFSPTSASSSNSVKKRQSAAISKYERNSIVKGAPNSQNSAAGDLDLSEIEIRIKQELQKD